MYSCFVRHTISLSVAACQWLGGAGKGYGNVLGSNLQRFLGAATSGHHWPRFRRPECAEGNKMGELAFAEVTCRSRIL